MFQNLQPEPEREAPSQRVRRLLTDARVRVLLLLLLVMGALCLSGAAYAWSRAISYDCEVEEVDLSVDELVALRKRVRSYQRATSPEARLTISDDEFSFFVWNKLGYRAKFSVEGEEVSSQTVLPWSNDTCYNVTFRGGVRVREGVATVTPERLVIGDLDVSGWVPAALELSPTHLNEHASEALDNTVHMEVVDGRFVMSLDDPWKIW